MRPFYESPDMYVKNRINFYDSRTRLCGLFIGYVDQVGDEFKSFPIGKPPRTFDNIRHARFYLTGIIPVIVESQETKKIDLTNQMTLF